MNATTQTPTAIVTGGAGFIGSHLCESLLGDNYRVIVIDNLQTGFLENSKTYNSNKNYSFLLKNVQDGKLSISCDEIWNLACPASPIHYQQNPMETMLTNILGAYNTLHAAKMNHAKYLHTSTSEVYGDPDCNEQAETYNGNVNIRGPRACYDEGKRASETLIYDWCRTNQEQSCNIRIARLFNTYGPRMYEHDGRVVSNFICQALRGEKITIYGSGKQTRSFCYIDDTIKALRLLMQTSSRSLFTFEKNVILPTPFNVGNPNEITVLELAETIIELVGSKSDITFFPLPQDDPQKRKPNITRAKTALNWEPTVSLRTGLLRTITYFDEKLTADGSKISSRNHSRVECFS